MRTQVQSLASPRGLRIQCCFDLSCSSDSTPSLGTSICFECYPKKMKKKKKLRIKTQMVDFFSFALFLFPNKQSFFIMSYNVASLKTYKILKSGIPVMAHQLATMKSIREVRFLALLSGLRIQRCMSCGVDHRCSSDPELLWLWCKQAAAVLIGPLPWETPYSTSAAPPKIK